MAIIWRTIIWNIFFRNNENWLTSFRSVVLEVRGARSGSGQACLESGGWISTSQSCHNAQETKIRQPVSAKNYFFRRNRKLVLLFTKTVNFKILSKLTVSIHGKICHENNFRKYLFQMMSEISNDFFKAFFLKTPNLM